MMPKLSKDAVDYSKGLPDAHCGICEYYRAGQCLLVAGDIDPNYWCDRFKAGVRATIVKAALDQRPHGPQGKGKE